MYSNWIFSTFSIANPTQTKYKITSAATQRQKNNPHSTILLNPNSISERFQQAKNRRSSPTVIINGDKENFTL